MSGEGFTAEASRWLARLYEEELTLLARFQSLADSQTEAIAGEPDALRRIFEEQAHIMEAFNNLQREAGALAKAGDAHFAEQGASNPAYAEILDLRQRVLELAAQSLTKNTENRTLVEAQLRALDREIESSNLNRRSVLGYNAGTGMAAPGFLDENV